MRKQLQWEELHKTMERENYEWDTCYKHAKKIRRRRMIIKYIGAILVVFLICLALYNRAFPRSPHEYTKYYQNGEMVVYVNGEAKSLWIDEEALKAEVLPSEVADGEFELILPVWGVTKPIRWQLEEEETDVFVIDSERIVDGKPNFGMMGEDHWMQRLKIGVKAGSEGMFCLTAGEQTRLWVQYACEEKQ